MAEEHTFAVDLEQVQQLAFQATFDWPHAAPIMMDEPPPLGGSCGPNASRLLAAAVGNCLSASLAFCLQKARIPVQGIKTAVRGKLVRNAAERLRIGPVDVNITVDFGESSGERAARCLSLFEDFCVVSASVRGSIPIRVTVQDQNGTTIYTNPEPGH